MTWVDEIECPVAQNYRIMSITWETILLKKVLDGCAFTWDTEKEVAQLKSPLEFIICCHRIRIEHLYGI